jgi:hypothetical protein
MGYWVQAANGYKAIIKINVKANKNKFELRE